MRLDTHGDDINADQQGESSGASADARAGAITPSERHCSDDTARTTP